MVYSTNITLRPISPVDIDFMLRVENDPEVWSYSTLNDAPYLRQEIEEFCAEQCDDTQCRYVIVCDGESYGFIDLYDIANTTASLSIILYPHTARGRGIGRRALELFEQLALRHYNIEELVAEISPCNSCSIAFFEKSGYSYVGSGRFTKRINFTL